MTTLRNVSVLAALAVCLVLPGAAGAQEEPPAEPDPGLFPTAEFSALPTSGTAPVDVQFTDASQPGVLGDGVDSWAWDFDGNGTVDSTERHPSHLYDSPGTYTVTLTVTDGVVSDPETKTGYITVVPDPPEASFTAGPKDPSVPLALKFTDTSEDPPDGSIVKREWDFDGDGTIDSMEESPEYTFASGGTKSVSLTVTDDDNATNTVRQDVVVNDPPTADFGAAAIDPSKPRELTFTDKSADADPGSVMAWAWDFENDGTVDSTVQNPIHSFAGAGPKTVTLTVTDDEGATATASRPVGVNAAPSASFTASSLTGEAPFEPTFTSTATDPDGSIASYEWSFGDGTTGSGPSVSHRYTAPGTYDVRLTVTDDDGARSSATKTIAVTLPPESIPAGPAAPTLQKVLTDLLIETPGPCSVRMLTASALVVCGGNSRRSLNLRTWAVNAEGTPVAATVSGSERIPRSKRRRGSARKSAKAKRARYRTRRGTVPAYGTMRFKLKAPKKLRRALAARLKQRGRIKRKPVVVLRAGGLTATMKHTVVARGKKKKRG